MDYFVGFVHRWNYSDLLINITLTTLFLMAVVIITKKLLFNKSILFILLIASVVLILSCTLFV